MPSNELPEITLRHEIRPGDLGRVTTLHGALYADEYGFDVTFEAYVALTLGEFARAVRPGQDRLWIAERGDEVVGSIGIIGREGNAAQLRWFLVHPSARGRGLGWRLLEESLAFCRAARYESVYLWTVHTLEAAARLYTAAGFRLTEEKDLAPLWGQMLAEQRYDLRL